MVLRRGSKKAVSRRCLERPCEEYALLGVRPNLGIGSPLQLAFVFLLENGQKPPKNEGFFIPTEPGGKGAFRP